MRTKRKTGGDFDWIAPVYDALAFVVFGQRLRQAQAMFLDQIPSGTSVLLVGGGTGWLLEQVLMRCQPKRVTYLDASAQMVALTSRRLLRRGVVGSVDFRVGDQTALTSDERFDIILTPFVLDLFTESALRSDLIPRLRTVLKPGGLWLVTDFVRTDAWIQKLLLWSMIRFFRVAAGIEVRQLADWQQLLKESGLTRQKQHRYVDGMVSAEVWVP